MMKKSCCFLFTAILAVFVFLVVSCEMEDYEEGYNTSKGAGVDMNFSGIYRGRQGVPVVPARGITNLLLSQHGNMVQVWDNRNSYYEGHVGAPSVVMAPVGITVPAGTTVAEAHINFSGIDTELDRKVDFAGFVRAVSVSESEANSSSRSTNSTVSVISTNLGVVTTQIITSAGSMSAQYNITEGNRQYILEGRWMVEGSATTPVYGVARASQL